MGRILIVVSAVALKGTERKNDLYEISENENLQQYEPAIFTIFP